MALTVLVLIMVFLSLLIHLVPGDPARIILKQRATPELIAQVRNELGLDEPVYVQLWDFLAGAFHGNLGEDFYSNRPVRTIVADVLPDTLMLAASSIVLSLLVGVPLGVIAVRRPNSLLDRVLGAISILFLSGLTFVVGLALLLVFAVRLQWLPALGAGSLSDPIDYLRHLILPAIALAVPWWSYLARLIRASMLEVMGSNYIRAARAFGFRERVVFYRCALKNALVPVVGVFGLMVGYTIAGTVFVEVIFTRPGLGTLEPRRHYRAELAHHPRGGPRVRRVLRRGQPHLRPLLSLPRPTHPG